MRALVSVTWHRADGTPLPEDPPAVFEAPEGAAFGRPAITFSAEAEPLPPALAETELELPGPPVPDVQGPPVP